MNKYLRGVGVTVLGYLVALQMKDVHAQIIYASPEYFQRQDKIWQINSFITKNFTIVAIAGGVLLISFAVLVLKIKDFIFRKKKR